MLPELAKSCHPVFGRVPGDDHAVDRAIEMPAAQFG
jgi:hypothetical protein